MLLSQRRWTQTGQKKERSTRFWCLIPQADRMQWAAPSSWGLGCRVPASSTSHRGHISTTVNSQSFSPPTGVTSALLSPPRSSCLPQVSCQHRCHLQGLLASHRCHISTAVTSQVFSPCAWEAVPWFCFLISRTSQVRNSDLIDFRIFF